VARNEMLPYALFHDTLFEPLPPYLNVIVDFSEVLVEAIDPRPITGGVFRPT
jgi:hypothetical protein